MKNNVRCFLVLANVILVGVAFCDTVELTVPNGSFEGSISGWAHAGAGDAVALEVLIPPYYESDRAPDGDYVAALTGFSSWATSTLTSSTIWTVPDYAEDATVSITAWFRGRSGSTLASQPYMEVLVNGSVAESNYPGYQTGWVAWTEFSVLDVDVDPGDVVTVKLGVQADGNGNSHTMWFDDVQATATYVPEPATMTVLLSCAAMMGLRKRRNK